MGNGSLKDERCHTVAISQSGSRKHGNNDTGLAGSRYMEKIGGRCCKGQLVIRDWIAKEEDFK